MKRPPLAALPALALALLCAAAGAQTAPAPVSAPPAETPAPSRPEAQVDRRVIQDEDVLIEETRFRGQSSNIVVHNKRGGLKGTQYELVPPSAARDPSVPGQAAGQRVWRIKF